MARHSQHIDASSLSSYHVNTESTHLAMSRAVSIRKHEYDVPAASSASAARPPHVPAKRAPNGPVNGAAPTGYPLIAYPPIGHPPVFMPGLGFNGVGYGISGMSPFGYLPAPAAPPQKRQRLESGSSTSSASASSSSSVSSAAPAAFTMSDD